MVGGLRQDRVHLMIEGYPDLQALVERRGGYHLITPEDWREHDLAVVAWQAKYRRDLPRPPQK